MNGFFVLKRGSSFVKPGHAGLTNDIREAWGLTKRQAARVRQPGEKVVTLKFPK